MSGLIICAPYRVAIVQSFGIFAMAGSLPGVPGVIGGFTSKYDYATMGSRRSTDLPVPGAGQNYYAAAAAGNNEYGMFAGGNSVTMNYMPYVYTYTYVDDTVGSMTNLSAGRQAPAGACNGPISVIGGGFTGVSPYYSKTMDRYVMADKTTSVTTSLPIGRYLGSAMGNGTNAYFTNGSGGNAAKVVDMYTYATAVMTPSVVTLVAINVVAPATYGIKTDGFAAGGEAAATASGVDRVVYATNTRVVGTTLINPMSYCGAAATATQAFIGGSNKATSVGAINVYTFADATMTTGSTVEANRSQSIAVSSAPGHF